jgi:hypothetical protein
MLFNPSRTLDDNFISLFIIHPLYSLTAHLPTAIPHLYYVFHAFTTLTNAGTSVYIG